MTIEVNTKDKKEEKKEKKKPNTFKKAFNLAREHGKEAFFYKNKEYNTRKAGESAEDHYKYLEARTPKQFQKLPKQQAGGQMQQQQLMQQIAQLIQQGGPEQAVQALMAQGASQEQATQLVQQVMQAMGGTPSARQGAKLNYLKSLQGICAADEYLTYFKAGGSICPVCAKKKQIQEAKCGKKLQKGGGVSKTVDAIKSQLRSKR